MSVASNTDRDDRYSYVFIGFRAWRTNPRTGEKEWAKDHGKRAWPIWIRIKK